VKRLFFILSLFSVAACTQLQPVFHVDTPIIDPNTSSAELLRDSCDGYSYDNTDRPCNLVGWQEFVFESLLQSKEDHEKSLNLLGNTQEDVYKRLILLSMRYESLEVRNKAKDVMLNVSSENVNGFGRFFYSLAHLLEQQITTEHTVIDLQKSLKSSAQKNTKLKAELADTKAKIQAIMEIEKNLNAN
jgi:hypothetical protein